MSLYDPHKNKKKYGYVIKINCYLRWSAEDELRGLTGWRKKLLCSLVGQQRMLHELLAVAEVGSVLWYFSASLLLSASDGLCGSDWKSLTADANGWFSFARFILYNSVNIRTSWAAQWCECCFLCMKRSQLRRSGHLIRIAPGHLFAEDFWAFSNRRRHPGRAGTHWRHYISHLARECLRILWAEPEDVAGEEKNPITTQIWVSSVK